MNHERVLVMVRGRAERRIDIMLSSESIMSTREMFEAMEPVVKNLEDAILGYMFGDYVESFNNYVRRKFKRPPTQEEEEEAANAIFNRVWEIRSRIRETNR